MPLLRLDLWHPLWDRSFLPLILQRLGPLDPFSRPLPSSFEKISGKDEPHVCFPDCVGPFRSCRTKGIPIWMVLHCGTSSESTTGLSVSLRRRCLRVAVGWWRGYDVEPFVLPPHLTSRALGTTTFDLLHHVSGSDGNAELNWQMQIKIMGAHPPEITKRRVLDAVTLQHTVLHDDHILSRCPRDDHRLCELLGENSIPHTRHGDFDDNGVELSHPESESKS